MAVASVELHLSSGAISMGRISSAVGDRIHRTESAADFFQTPSRGLLRDPLAIAPIETATEKELVFPLGPGEHKSPYL